MSKKKNIIGKQYLDISFQGATDAFAFRDQVSWMCTTKLLPAIEKVLDERSPKDKIYYIEKLVIDVGELPKDNWESFFLERVIDQILKRVTRTSSSFRSSPSSSQSHFLTVGKTQEVESKQNSMVEIEEEQSIKQTIFSFLRTGLLPWNASIKNNVELSEALSKLIESRQALDQLIQLILSHDHVLQRLVQQFNVDLLDKIILMQASISSHVLTDIKTSLTALIKLTDVPSIRQQQIIYEGMLASVVGNTSKSESAFVSYVIERVFEKIKLKTFVQSLMLRNDFTYEIFLEAFNNRIGQIISSENICYQIKSYLKNQVTEASIIETLKSKKTLESEKILKSENIIKGESVKDVKSKKDVKTKSAHKPGIEPIHIDEVYINNAGLVILHPFLHLLFENVGYTENKVWLTDETQERAIALTQYMVTGMELAPEFDLLLNKILVGYPIEKTLPIDIILSDFEKQEADDVLNSVIKHWTALKNTSIEGLRSTFLNRDGKLFKDDVGWSLKVEQKTADILMNRLPWGFSMVKTPWMETMMKVEWT